jgi:hypothetical protein
MWLGMGMWLLVSIGVVGELYVLNQEVVSER